MYQIGQLEDITDRKLLADRLAHDAAHDSMTGLLNRASFTERVSAALADARRPRGRGAVHRPRPLQGRERQPRARGRRRARDDRRATPPQHAAPRQCDRALRRRRVRRARAPTSPARQPRPRSRRRLLDAVAEPVALDDRGGVRDREHRHRGRRRHGDTSETLLRHADAAMYRAKNDGRGPRRAVPARRRTVSAVAALRTGTDLHRALERDELVVHYQPIVNLRTGPRDRLRGAACAGTTPNAVWSRRPTSSRWPRRPGSSCRSARGCSRPRAASSCTGRPCATAARKRGRLAMNVNLSPRQLADPTLAETRRAHPRRRRGSTPTPCASSSPRTR